MPSTERSFELPEIPDVRLSSRPVIEILDFVEEVTSSPFEDLTIQDPRDSSGAFPFRALLDFVEASCENPLQDLVILHSEELRNHKIKLIQLVQERYSAAFAEHFDAVYRQINSSPYLHHRIFELQVELSKMNATLKKQETDLAVLSSALNHQTLGGYYGPKGVDPETDPDIELSHKRRRPSQPSQSSQQYGFDGVDDRTMDTPTRRSTYASSDRRPSGSASSHSYHGSDIPVQHVPRGLPPVPMSPQQRWGFDCSAALSQSPQASTSAEFRHTSWAASISSAHSGFDRFSMPPPNEPRSYAPGLALRKPKMDEYDPLGRLVPRDEYTHMKDKDDAELRGAWTTIDPEDKTRNWDRLREEERSQSGSAESFSRRGPWSRWNTSSIANSDQGIDRASWPAPQGEGDRFYPANSSVDPCFEDPELDVDPEVRAQFRGVTELLQHQTGPRSAFEQRNKNVLSHNASAPIKVIIGGQVVKTLNRNIDNRGELRNRHGKYIDGHDRGLMKKHLEEDRKKMIMERDEQLIRATQEKRAWDAMDPGEKETRLAKKARNKFLVGRLGAGVGSHKDTYETDEIPDIYIRKVPAGTIAAWSEISTPPPSSSVAEHDNYFRPGQDDETLSFNSSNTLTPQAADSRRSNARIRAESTGRYGDSTTAHGQGSSVGTAARHRIRPNKFQCEAAAEKFDLTTEASSKRGRVVTVTLHEPVAYSTSAIAERLFGGGAIQEIQFFPEERQALVVFVHPHEAAAFIEHVQSVKERNRKDYRRLQINAEFYRGVEMEAVYPAQKYILAAVIAAEATRSILLRGLPTTLSLDEFARHIKFRLSKILVKVTLVKVKNSFTRKREGDIGILDFASIRDAVEVIEAFGSKKVSDYTQCAAEWLPDPCCNVPSKRDYCHCMHCYKRSVLKSPELL